MGFGWTDRGREMLLGVYAGQLPAPELYLRPHGWVPGAVPQRIRPEGFAHAMGDVVTLGPAPGGRPVTSAQLIDVDGLSQRPVVTLGPMVPGGWRIWAMELVDEPGEVLARDPLDEPIILEPEQSLEYGFMITALGVDLELTGHGDQPAP